MLSKMTVWVDCDGPLADILKPTLAAINAYDREPQGLPLYTHADVKDWDLFSCLNLSATAERVVRGLWQAPGFCAALPVTEGAKQAMGELSTFCDVRIATTLQVASPTWAYDRLRWLQREFDISANKVAFIHDKSSLRGDLLIDDKPSHIAEANIPAFLYKMAYSTPGVKAYTWPEIIKAARKLAESFERTERE